MPEFEFDVDASIAAGWERFAVRLAGFLRDLVPGATFDLTVPVLGVQSSQPPFIRFTTSEPDSDATHTAVLQERTRHIEAEVSGGGAEDHPIPLRSSQLDQLAGLGWEVTHDPAAATRARIRLPAFEAPHLSHLVAGTMERVFGIPTRCSSTTWLTSSTRPPIRAHLPTSPVAGHRRLRPVTRPRWPMIRISIRSPSPTPIRRPRC
ncbi:hypothetical protein ACFSSF_08425 [Dietzia aerolata]|uniref:TY-Chap domain-containing protein n=1 Tax=Dietzia aerolata TaxID=595984 RepID=UPI0036291C58